MSQSVSSHIAKNIRQLRQVRGLTQGQCSKAAGIPRPTWSNLESGEANPTITILGKVAQSFQVSVEELIRAPRTMCQFFPADSVKTRNRGGVLVRELLPESIIGIEIERLHFEAKAILKGNPHTPGTREYLTCERGEIHLIVSGEKWVLTPGDVVVFRGDQKHSYHNPHSKQATAYSVIVLSALERN